MAISREVVEKALREASKRPANLRYFFSHLTSAEWIDPLRQIGVFASPPAPVREENYVIFPPWPESEYLVRMAPLAPEKVCEIFRGLPDTDNASVHNDRVDSAIVMPGPLAASLAKLEGAWIRKSARLFGLYPEKAGHLVAHLAVTGEIKAAITLAAALLEVVTKPNTVAAEYTLPAEPMAKFDNWHYERILANDIPALCKVAGKECLGLFADLLNTAITINASKNEDTAEDYSWIWRPEIGHEHLKDFKEISVNGVRDTALEMANRSEKDAEWVFLFLVEKERRLFKRIAYYILGTVAHPPIGLVKAVLSDRSNYESSTINPEFNLVLSRGLSKVEEEARKSVLALIEKGPDPDRIREMHRRWDGTELTDGQIHDQAEIWRLGWLHVVAEDLAGEIRSRYDYLLEKYGKPRPRVESSGGVWVGPSSPKSVEELQGLKPAELVEYLKEFKATGEWGGATPEGLSRVLSVLVSANPGKFASEAELIIGLDPTYVRGVVDGLQEAVKKKGKFSWDLPLALMEWAVSNPRVIVERKGSFGDSDPDWGWTRKSIAGLLSSATVAGLIDIKHAASVWNILEVLAEDPDPDPSRETDYLKANQFWSFLALNTVRGVALEAVVNYGIWTQEAGLHSAATQWKGVLDLHLDLGNDPSYVVREVIGHKLPWLVKLDPEWVKDNLAKIFPPTREDHRAIAWENYLLANVPYDLVLPVLLTEYEWAITILGKNIRKKWGDVERQLAHHLFAFAWRGKLPLEGGLLEQFYDHASPELRLDALDFVGRSLRSDPKDPIPEPVLGRLKKLWSSRLAAVTERKQSPHELVAFGWWFSSEVFEFEWALDQLLTVLRLAKAAEPDHLVVETLAEYVEQKPLQVLEALQVIIEADKKGWSIHGWQEHAREILERAFSLDNAEVTAAAKRVVDLLVAKGHMEYRALWQAAAAKKNQIR